MIKARVFLDSLIIYLTLINYLILGVIMFPFLFYIILILYLFYSTLLEVWLSGFAYLYPRNILTERERAKYSSKNSSKIYHVYKFNFIYDFNWYEIYEPWWLRVLDASNVNQRLAVLLYNFSWL